MPPSFSGNGTFEVFNKGQQNHEMAVYKIADGKTARRRAGVPRLDRASDRPAARHSCQAASRPRRRARARSSTLDLTSGNYVMMCFLPDTKTGAPHFTLGMIQPFTVSSTMLA